MLKLKIKSIKLTIKGFGLFHFNLYWTLNHRKYDLICMMTVPTCCLRSVQVCTNNSRFDRKSLRVPCVVVLFQLWILHFALGAKAQQSLWTMIQVHSWNSERVAHILVEEGGEKEQPARRKSRVATVKAQRLWCGETANSNSGSLKLIRNVNKEKCGIEDECRILSNTNKRNKEHRQWLEIKHSLF